MKITAVHTVEQCLDGTWTKDIIFSAPVTRSFIEALQQIGEVKYYADFPRPFYTVDVAGAFSLRGVEGSASVRMITVAGGGDPIQVLDKFLSSNDRG